MGTSGRRRGLGGLALAALLAAAAAWAWRARASVPGAEPPERLPAFAEVPDGPRAPARAALFAEIGRSSRAQVEALAAERNLACKDTSARALLRQARARRADPGASADGVDLTTSASARTRSPLEANPQVRLSCEGAPSSALDDRVRPPASGRALFIFDSPSHPLRHASFRRVHTDQAAALADLTETLAAMRARWGAPQKWEGALPGTPLPGAAAAEAIFEPYAPFRAEWRWADLRVEVSALSFGARGVDVYEAVEVPWPVRSDGGPAPAFARRPKE